MAKPVNGSVRWADDVGATVLEPSEGKKDVGWLAGEQPAAAHINYNFRELGAWTQYLDNLESSESLTWALAQIFQNQITLGSGLLANDTNATLPRIIAEPGSVTDYTCIAKFKDARLWIAKNTISNFLITVNADREITSGNETGKWKKLTNGAQALVLDLGRDRLRVGAMPAAQNTAWTDAFISGEGTSGGWGAIFDLPSDSEADSASQADFAHFQTQVSSTAGVERRLLFEFHNAASGAIRIYYVISGTEPNASGYLGALEIVKNIKWSNTNNNWTRDTNAASVKLVLNQNIFGVYHASTSVSSPFVDTAFGTVPLRFGFNNDFQTTELGNGFLGFLDTATVSSSDSNPPSNAAPGANRLHAKNIPKAWGRIAVTTVSSNVQDGYNVASVSNDNAADTVTVTFATPMESVNYSVVLTPAAASGTVSDFWEVTAQLTTSFTCRATRLNTVGPAIVRFNVGADSGAFSFAVHARQSS